jgi:hypothetical protein
VRPVECTGIGSSDKSQQCLNRGKYCLTTHIQEDYTRMPRETQNIAAVGSMSSIIDLRKSYGILLQAG